MVGDGMIGGGIVGGLDGRRWWVGRRVRWLGIVGG
jgi:hypothetical protein